MLFMIHLPLVYRKRELTFFIKGVVMMAWSRSTNFYHLGSVKVTVFKNDILY